jgi:hypothetical protein
MASMIEGFRAVPVLLLFFASSAVVVPLSGCGGSSGPSNPDGGATPIPTPTPVPTPTPTPTPSQSEACRLTAPTVNCSTHNRRPQEMADALQTALETAKATRGAMYADNPTRIYDLDLFRSRTVDSLTAAGLCGAWDYGNEIGDEIYVRSADGCVVEQYDIITGEGGVRNANKGSNAWQEGFEVPVPEPKPQFSREGDLTCSLPGDRSTFCFSIKGTPGEFGAAAYAAVVAVMKENPALFDPNDTIPAQGEFIPDQLRVATWRILNQDAYIAAIETKLRAAGFCAYVDKGDILKVKKVSMGNIFHEEMDIVQNPKNAGGAAHASFTVKDRCHNAGF